MYGQDLLMLISLCCGIFQDCATQDCKVYEDSNIGCNVLQIENGHVCYTKMWRTTLWGSRTLRWHAAITCSAGFYIGGTHTCISECRWFISYYWTFSNGTTSCLPVPTTTVTPSTSAEQGNDSLLAVYILVPLLVLGLLVGGGLVLCYFYRMKRRETSSNGVPCNMNATETNKTYRDECTTGETADNSNSEYVEITDYVNQSTDDNNYNKLHMGGQCVGGPKYNHIPVQSDAYDHTTHTGGNAEGESQTYSHLNDNQPYKQSPDRNKIGNIYNGSHVGDDRFNTLSEDPHYDHTDTRSDAQVHEKCPIPSIYTYLNRRSATNDFPIYTRH